MFIFFHFRISVGLYVILCCTTQPRLICIYHWKHRTRIEGVEERDEAGLKGTRVGDV